jgi:hypothetical protein
MKPSADSLLDIKPTPPVMVCFVASPFFKDTSKTDEILLPKFAGPAPLYSVIPLTMSGLKAEKKPNKCEGL